VGKSEAARERKIPKVSRGELKRRHVPAPCIGVYPSFSATDVSAPRFSRNFTALVLPESTPLLCRGLSGKAKCERTDAQQGGT
jgi:hypothetical protein